MNTYEHYEWFLKPFIKKIISIVLQSSYIRNAIYIAVLKQGSTIHNCSQQQKGAFMKRYNPSNPDEFREMERLAYNAKAARQRASLLLSLRAYMNFYPRTESVTPSTYRSKRIASFPSTMLSLFVSAALICAFVKSTTVILIACSRYRKHTAK